MEVRNRFKGLDLIDREPDELWMEVCSTVQETGIKTIPREKKCKKAKWLSEEALKIVVKRREANSVKNTIGSLIGIALTLYIALGGITILTILILPVREHGIFLHLFVSSLISFISVL